MISVTCGAIQDRRADGATYRLKNGGEVGRLAVIGVATGARRKRRLLRVTSVGSLVDRR
jgi:hypothetical protein